MCVCVEGGDGGRWGGIIRSSSFSREEGIPVQRPLTEDGGKGEEEEAAKKGSRGWTQAE